MVVRKRVLLVVAVAAAFSSAGSVWADGQCSPRDGGNADASGNTYYCCLAGQTLSVPSSCGTPTVPNMTGNGQATNCNTLSNDDRTQWYVFRCSKPSYLGLGNVFSSNNSVNIGQGGKAQVIGGNSFNAPTNPAATNTQCQHRNPSQQSGYQDDSKYNTYYCCPSQTPPTANVQPSSCLGNFGYNMQGSAQATGCLGSGDDSIQWYVYRCAQADPTSAGAQSANAQQVPTAPQSAHQISPAAPKSNSTASSSCVADPGNSSLVCCPSNFSGQPPAGLFVAGCAPSTLATDGTICGMPNELGDGATPTGTEWKCSPSAAVTANSLQPGQSPAGGNQQATPPGTVTAGGIASTTADPNALPSSTQLQAVPTSNQPANPAKLGSFGDVAAYSGCTDPSCQVYVPASGSTTVPPTVFEAVKYRDNQGNLNNLTVAQFTDKNSNLGNDTVGYAADTAAAAAESKAIDGAGMSSDALQNDKDNSDEAKQKDSKTAESSAQADCKTSETIIGSASQGKCKSSQMHTETAKIINVVGQAGGSLAVQQQGATSYQNVQQQGGSMQSIYQGAAANAKRSGEMEVGVGAVNMVMGVMQYSDASKHGNYAALIKKNITSNSVAGAYSATAQAGSDGTLDPHSQDGQDVQYAKNATVGLAKYKSIKASYVAQFQQADDLYNSDNAKYTKAKADAAANPMLVSQAQLQTLKQKVDQDQAARKRLHTNEDSALTDESDAATAAGQQEQNTAKATSQAGGLGSILSGAQQLMMGMSNLAAANQYNQAAQALGAASGGSAPGMDSFPNPQGGPGGPNTISGTPQSGAAQSASSSTDPGTGNNLGNPIGTPPAGGVDGTPPAPGNFNASNPGAGSPGGGGGLGGANTAAAPPDTSTDAAAKAADQRNVAYEGGAGGGGGGRGPASAGDKAPDLSGLLAQFLPKEGDQNQNQNGILDYGGGAGRNPAAEGPISLLDKNADIFSRIHDTYQDKNRRGLIGI